MRLSDRIRSALALLLVAAVGTSLCPTAKAQERTVRDYDVLIEKLEVGLSALDELGRDDARERVARIAAEVRRKRDAARERREANGEVREVRRRLGVMRYAVDALVEADRHDAADLVERAMHSRELAIEGRRDAEAQRIRESAPNRAQLTELLRLASELHAERGRADRAKALADLSEIYREQWERRRNAQAQRSEEVAARLVRLCAQLSMAEAQLAEVEARLRAVRERSR